MGEAKGGNGVFRRGIQASRVAGPACLWYAESSRRWGRWRLLPETLRYCSGSLLLLLLLGRRGLLLGRLCRRCGRHRAPSVVRQATPGRTTRYLLSQVLDARWLHGGCNRQEGARAGSGSL